MAHKALRSLRYPPDGEWIAFWTGSELRKVRVSGGPSARICAAIQVTGLTWGSTRLVFTTRYQMLEVSPDGGTPRALTASGKLAQSAAAWFADDLTLSGQFAISPEGTLAYVPSPSVSLPTSDLVRVNRRGDVSALGAPPNTYRERVEVSPDGTTLAVTVQSTTDVRLFLYDMARGTLAPAFAAASGARHDTTHLVREGCTSRCRSIDRGKPPRSPERRSNRRCRRALVAAERIRAQFVAAQG